METWRDLSRSNRTVANELFFGGRWRSCASRAYYAAYSEITHALLIAGVTMPASQNNPKHKTLPSLIGNNLTLLQPAQRWRLSGIAHSLYNFRIIADYLPTVLMEEEDARVAIGLMTQVFVLLKDVP